ncbi:MAG TPA: hypothetical protein VEK38_03130 [Candidatus Bathyarchaeia archaeon]|nr:hypothetical protein [Candidatus Bathyarchaeia archaeon]
MKNRMIIWVGASLLMGIVSQNISAFYKGSSLFSRFPKKYKQYGCTVAKYGALLALRGAVPFMVQFGMKHIRNGNHKVDKKADCKKTNIIKLPTLIPNRITLATVRRMMYNNYYGANLKEYALEKPQKSKKQNSPLFTATDIMNKICQLLYFPPKVNSGSKVVPVLNPSQFLKDGNGKPCLKSKMF